MLDYISKEGKNSIVLFIHGLTSDNDTWKHDDLSLPELLLEDDEIKNHFDMAYLSYYTKLADFKKTRFGLNIIKSLIPQTKSSYVPINKGIISIADIVYDTINLNLDEYENVIIIAHSMGGLISKYCILRNLVDGNEDKIKLFLSLAAPHQGSEWANVGKRLFSNKQIIDLAPISETLDQLNRDWVDKKNDLPKTIYFYGKDDVIVKEQSAVAIGAERTTTIACEDDHFSITKPDRINKN